MTRRREFISRLVVIASTVQATRQAALAAPDAPDLKWYEAAAEMRRLAESWGDQSYGAVLVADGVVIGEGPSRVLKDKNPDAHAERVAILDAQRRLGRKRLEGSTLYSTSRPCSVCEAAALEAGVGRMYFGPRLEDAGPPHRRAQ